MTGCLTLPVQEKAVPAAPWMEMALLQVAREPPRFPGFLLEVAELVLSNTQPLPTSSLQFSGVFCEFSGVNPLTWGSASKVLTVPAALIVVRMQH